MKKIGAPSAITTALMLTFALAGCSTSNDSTPVEEVYAPTSFGPFATGTSSAPVMVYFDLDSGQVLELTEEQASTNEEWDIAFQRTKVYLNNNGAQPVSVYSTGNNSEFYDADGAPVVDTFVNATAEAELADYEAVTSLDIPADEMFISDVTERILDGFYNYDGATHQVTANDANYYVTQTDGEFTKFNVSSLVQDGFGMTSVTFGYANQLAGETEFGTEQSLTLDLAMLCSGNDAVYVDFSAGMEVTSTDAYDVSIPCSGDMGSFQLDLAESSSAIQDFNNVYTGVAVEAVRHYGFQPNEYTVNAFSQANWYAYNLQGGHQLWSQYGVYIVKTPTQNFKLQITSYYDAEGNSGNYSFNADVLAD